MFLIDLLMDKLAEEVKNAPGWLTLIIVCNVLLLWQVVLEAVEGLGIHIGDEKELIATLAAIVLFLAGDMVDTMVFPRKKGAERGMKIFEDIMLALLICAFFFLIEKRWIWLAWFAGAFGVLWLIHYCVTRWRDKRKERQTAQEGKAQEAVEEPKSPVVKPPVEYIGWLKHFQSSDLITERENAGTSLELAGDQYAVSKSLALAAGKFNWTRIYFQNESAKFLRSLVIPAFVAAGLYFFYWRQWIYGVLGVAATVGFLASYFWLKQLHMIRLYQCVQDMVALDKDKSKNKQSYFADNLNGRRVFFWKGSLVGSGKAAKEASTGVGRATGSVT